MAMHGGNFDIDNVFKTNMLTLTMHILSQPLREREKAKKTMFWPFVCIMCGFKWMVLSFVL